MSKAILNYSRKEVDALKRFFLLLVVLFSLFAAASNAFAATNDSQDCILCHSSTVSDFGPPNVPTVERLRCYLCHTQGLHTRSYNGYNIYKAYYTDPATGTQKVAIFMQNPDNVATVNLHVYHSQPDPRASGCIDCHLSYSCNSCHQTVPHASHSSTKFPQASVWMTSGVFGAPNYYNNSCTTSNCHGQFTESYKPVVNRSDGQQLCVNCHPANIDKSQGTASDTSGHNTALLETSHSTTLPNQLTIGGLTKTVDCSGCHVYPLTTEHASRARDCSACHNSANPGVLGVIAAAGKTPDNRACEKCHFNPAVLAPPTGTLRTEHEVFHIAAKSNNLAIDGTPHTDCNTCHQRAEILSTISTLANSTTKDYSCLNCHTGAPKPKAPVHKASYNGQAQLLTDLHPGCNTCHDTNVTYAKDPNRKPSNDVNTIIATKNGDYSCTDCHANLSAGHQAQFNGTAMTTTDYHLDCATCHSSSDPFVKSAITTLKGTTGYSCQACHAAARTAGEPPYSPLHSAQGEEITGYHTTNDCNSCHGVVNGAYKVNLSNIKPKTLTTGYGCTDCHGTQPGVLMGKHAGLVSGTAAPTDVSAKYHPTCSTCHKDARVTAKISALKASGVTSYLCSECHNTTIGLAPGHQAELSVDTNVAGTVYEITQFHINTSGTISCDKCHDNNSVLPTATIGALRAQNGYKCADCHNASLAPDHTAALAAGGTPESTVGYHQDCLTCHSKDAVKTNISTGTFGTSYLCTTCHNGSIAPQPSHSAKADASAAAENISTTYHASCNKCHGNSDYPEVNNIIKQTIANNETEYLCSKCHNATLNLEPKHQAKMAVSDAAYATITNYHLDAGGNTACSMCHGTTKLPAGTVAALKAAPSYLCDDCHTPTSVVKYSHTANYGTEAVDQKTTDYHRACQTCHDSAAASPVIKNLIGQTGYDCTQCHNGTTAKGALHQAKMSATDADAVNTVQYHPSCASCHSSVDTNVVNVINAKKGTGVPYECGDCHGGDLSAKHVSPTVLTGGMVNCSWCHTNQLIDTHINPTVMLTKQMACTTCHGAASPVQTQIDLGQKDCANCHDGATLDGIHPGNQYIPKHLAVYPSFIPEYSPNCVNCHYNGSLGSTPTVDLLHSKYLVGCNDCHNNTAYKPAITSQSTNCTGCHDKSVNPAMDMTATHDNFHTVNVAVYQDSASCLSCHKADTVVASAYTTYSSVNNLLAVHQKKPAYTKVATCDACHGTAARTEVKQAIANSNTNCTACHPSADHKHAVNSYETAPDVNCVNCHSTGTDPADATVKITELSAVHSKYGKTCTACHTSPFQGNVIAGDGAIDMLKGGSSAIYCSTCHNGDTANGYPVTREARHAPEHQAASSENVTCSGCHDGTTVKGSFNASTGTAVNFTGIHTVNNCNTCHDSAAVESVIAAKVGKANAAYDCAECHDGTKAKTHNKQHTVISYLNGSTDTSCATCHSSGDVTAVHNGNKGCDTCHGANPALPNTGTVIKANLSSNANRTGYTCQDCHSNISGGHSHNVVGFAATPNVDCAKCHTTPAGGPAELTAIHKDAADRGKIAGYGCATCHNSTFVGSVIGDGSLDMQRNGVPIYCDTCHDGVKADSIVNTAAAKPAKYPEHNGTHDPAKAFGTYTLEGNVDCSKCHTSMALAPTHDSASNPAGVTCNACHTSSNAAVAKVITDNWSRTTATTNVACADCHNTMPKVHAPEHVASTADTSVDCSGCHSGQWTGVSAKVAGVHKDNCNTCHASTNSVVSKFIADRKGIANPVYNCEGCHTTGGAQTTAVKHQPEHQAKHSATGMTCSSCHSFNVTAGTAADIKAVHKNGCNTCHGSTVRSDVKLVIAAKKGQVNPVYNCEDCHGTIHAGWDTKHKPVFPSDPTMNCASCHNNYLPTEHEKALTPSANTAIGYKVFRSTDNVNWTEIGSTTATGYANTGLAANTTYYYKVQAYDGKPNLSGFSNTVNVATLSSAGVATTVNPDAARYASGNNGDSSADPSSTTDVLARLTDNSTSTYSTVRENGSSDQYVSITENSDANKYTKVELKISVRYNNSGNLIIYPYQSNGTSINTSSTYYVKGTSRSSSSNYTTETIDVTKAANAMKGYGWMKFRIKPDPAGGNDTFYIANVQVVLTQNAVSGGTATNPSGTLTPNSNDTTAPTAPSGLTGTANYYDRVDLTWTASTDTGGAAGDTCSVCHAATAPQVAKNAIAAKNANCSACHTIHADITTAHTGNALPTTPWQCSGCHSNVLSAEHSANSKLTLNGALNCDTCHKSTLPKVQAAINSTATDKSNLKCEACHTGTADGVPAVHGDIAGPHLRGIFPTATDATCLNCHTTQAGEFAATKLSYHVVNGLTSKANTSYGSYLSPWTATSAVGCKGCHGNNNDGKAQVANILKRPYTYTMNSSNADLLCFLCHDRNTYGGGSGSSGRSGFSDGSNLHNIGDHESGRLQCSWCHSAVPHGTNKAHQIVTTSDPNSAGSVLTGYTHPASGQYNKSSCTSNLSLCDEHK